MDKYRRQLESYVRCAGVALRAKDPSAFRTCVNLQGKVLHKHHSFDSLPSAIDAKTMRMRVDKSFTTGIE